jgi:acid phosphatase class B
MKVIIDIDNTLCISNERFELAKKPNGKTDWDIAHKPELIENDKPNFPMIDLAYSYKSRGIEVVILTGRPESVREVTELWLSRYYVQYDTLIMRSWQDNFLKAPIFKKKMYEEKIKGNIFCAYDDDEDIIQMWNSLGINAFKVYAVEQ